MRAAIRSPLKYALLAAIVLLALPFVIYSAGFGWRGLTSDLGGQTHLFTADGPLTNTAVFLHMLAGAVLTGLVPLQLMDPLRRRFPALHRWAGRLLITLALLVAPAGVVYLASRGAIGGPLMDAGFALYGTLLFVTAIQTIRHARARRFTLHRRWALRFFVLAIGSWLYRLHYTLWYIATDGLWSNSAFTGAFDHAQNFAFYLPYLVLVELYLCQRPEPPSGRSNPPAGARPYPGSGSH